ncbi:hypothetical protein H671_6g16788 [Cricetulus griseus]|nr:hypothetical protein H671_6g16788 [Cricetulus griseus]
MDLNSDSGCHRAMDPDMALGCSSGPDDIITLGSSSGLIDWHGPWTITWPTVVAQTQTPDIHVAFGGSKGGAINFPVSSGFVHSLGQVLAGGRTSKSDQIAHLPELHVLRTETLGGGAAGNPRPSTNAGMFMGDIVL